MASVSYNGRSDRQADIRPRVDIRQNRPERPRLLRPVIWPTRDPRSRPGSPTADAEAIYRLERHAMDRDLREARRRFTLELDALPGVDDAG